MSPFQLKYGKIEEFKVKLPTWKELITKEIEIVINRIEISLEFNQNWQQF